MASEATRIKVLSVMLSAVIGGPIAAQQATKPRPADAPQAEELAKEVGRLRAEVAELRRLLAGALEADAQLAKALADYLRRAEPPRPPTNVASPGRAPEPAIPPAPPLAKGTVLGWVTLQGTPATDAYVFVEDIRGDVQTAEVEIVQRNLQFIPQALLIRKGTTVKFPNRDKIPHAVYSNSIGNKFNFTPYSRDEKARSFRFLSPGLVSIYCDIHLDMSAELMVVPNEHWVKVRSDGSFRLNGVPSGSHALKAWSPRAAEMKEATKVIVLAERTVPVSFELSLRPERVPTHKDGSPPGSYGR